ncbi:MAG: hypothetical protein IJ251_02645 [Oscillospiraceae bacterium]|nr:hypothetical protein [Oscillospiraceae bacterium]
MKADVFIYGRGKDRLEGFQTFAGPDYFTDDMLSAMMGFYGMHDEGDMSSAYPELFTGDDPWGRTYIFIAMPDPYCCALLRTTRVKDAQGGWLTEVRGKEIWSLEGLCAPFEDKEEFFALAPSLILWLESDRRSLYERFMADEIGASADIPDGYFVDPYREGTCDAAYEVMGDEYAAWKQMVSEIRFANGIDHFLFGAMAEVFAPALRSDYNITAVYGKSTKVTDLHDPFEDIHLVTEKTLSGRQRKRDLIFTARDINSGDPHYRWEIHSSEVLEDPLTAPLTPIPASGINVYEMLAEADTIKLFTDKLGWKEERPYSFTEEI